MRSTPLTPLAPVAPALPAPASAPPAHSRCVVAPTGWRDHRALYAQLAQPAPPLAARQRGAQFVRRLLLDCAAQPSDLPDAAQGLETWMHAQSDKAAAQYTDYLQARRQGAPRRYFGNRAHALHFLQSVAPTKLVDGSWLYGVVAHADNPRLQPLVRTYLEELGDGQPGKNHVTLYRQLLAQHGLSVPGAGSASSDGTGLDDRLYVQGLVQLALGWNAEEFLPEIAGFNLAYEQLPLHLLITAYELNELGIDPYYFTLHVTVDNRSSGHARMACDAVARLVPRHGGAKAVATFWQRVRAGALLADAGVGTTQTIASFEIEAEVLRILRAKARAGTGVHSDYCRVAGRTVNNWLAVPEDMPQFLAALEGSGWVRRGAPLQASRFWGLLQGERAEMFGVFNAYELQVICDWLRGPALSADGMPFQEAAAATAASASAGAAGGGAAAEGAGAAPTPRRRPSFRALQRAASRTAQFHPVHAGNASGTGTGTGTGAGTGTGTDAVTGSDSVGWADGGALDTDLPAFREHLRSLQGAARQQALVAALSPAEHWTPTGLYATRLFVAQAGMC